VHCCEEYEEDICDGSYQFPIDASSIPPIYHTDEFDVNFAHETDVFRSAKNGSGSNRIVFTEDHEDEFDAIFDIIDNFGISIEEGLVFFEKASEWLAARARDEARRVLLTRLGKDEKRNVDVHGSLLESNLLPVDPTSRAERLLRERLMPSAVRDRMVVAPENYLQGEFYEDRWRVNEIRTDNAWKFRSAAVGGTDNLQFMWF